MRFQVAALAAWATILTSGAASALIVWDGKIVPAWPDAAAPTAPPGAAFAAQNIGLYQHPKGNVYGLTLLIDFSDAMPAFTKSDIDAWLNQKGYNQGGLNGSVRDYYLDESNGVVDFQNEIFGFYRAQFPKSHYESTSDYSGSDELFSELMDYFDAQVDFSKYDNDKDGKTEAISIVYAGEAETWGKGLWPHASGSNQKRDGVTIARYMMTNLGTQLGLYTFSHEVGHMLFGWPDLYGFGNYCIMGNGSSQKNPVGINDFYRADQGWIPIVDVTADTNALFTAERNGAGYRYTNPSNPKESFFWSNVQNTGRFATISGNGLLLLHFDKNIGVNQPPQPLSLAVVEADGTKELGQTMWPDPGSDAKDFFHAGGVAEFSSTKFDTASWNDASPSQLHIYDVTASGDSMQFKVGNGPIVEMGGAGGMASGGAASGGTGGVAAMGGAMSGGATGGGVMSGVGGAQGGGVTMTGGGTATGGGPTGAGGALLAGAGGMGPPNSASPGGDASCGCRLGSSPRTGFSAFFALVLAGLLARVRRFC